MSKYISSLNSIAADDFETSSSNQVVDDDEDGYDLDGDIHSNDYQPNHRNNQPQDRQIQMSCCANMRFKQCVMNRANKVCKPFGSRIRFAALSRTSSVSSARMAQRSLERSMRDMMADLGKTLDSMALTGPEFICAGVDEQYCRRMNYDKKFGPVHTARHLQALGKTTVNNNLNRRHFTRRSTRQTLSILPAMIKIYSSRT